MTNHRPLSSAEGDEYRFALKPEATTAAVPLETKYMLICSACGVLYDGDTERACAAAGESPGRGEHITPRYPEPNAKEGNGKIGDALDVGRRLKDSEVVDPCPNCSAPVFLLDGVGLVRDYESTGPHRCPVAGVRAWRVGLSPGGQPRSGRKSLTDLCDYIAEELDDEGAGAAALFGRPNGMDYSLDCTDEASASERHVQGVRLWLLLDPEERRVFLNEWSAARKKILGENAYERVHKLRCALHDTSFLGFSVYHEHPGYTEISAPWMRLPGEHREGHGWIGIIANPDTLNGEPYEICYSLTTSDHDGIPGPTVMVQTWTDDVEENARLWRAATALAIGAVLRGVVVLMDGGDGAAAEKAMDTPVVTLDAEGIAIRD